MLSVYWAFRPKRFLDKTGCGWSRDAVVMFKMKFKDFLVLVSLKLLVMGYLENTLH